MRRATASTRRDLIGSPLFWGVAMVTLVSLVACFFLRNARAWIGLGVLLTLFTMMELGGVLPMG